MLYFWSLGQLSKSITRKLNGVLLTLIRWLSPQLLKKPERHLLNVYTGQGVKDEQYVSLPWIITAPTEKIQAERLQYTWRRQPRRGCEDIEEAQIN